MIPPGTAEPVKKPAAASAIGYRGKNAGRARSWTYPWSAIDVYQVVSQRAAGAMSAFPTGPNPRV